MDIFAIFRFFYLEVVVDVLGVVWAHVVLELEASEVSSLIDVLLNQVLVDFDSGRLETLLERHFTTESLVKGWLRFLRRWLR